ncbi:MAG: peptidylprolyl isomerase [Burkholderia sp.]|nr:peptidylprolyl isomerase [Burkholderia sp.]
MNKILRLQKKLITSIISILLFFQTPIIAKVISTSHRVKLTDKIIAIVNDDVVTSHELDQWVNLVIHHLKQQRITPILPIDELRRKILEEIIIKNIQIQKAKANNIYIGDKIEKTLLYLAQEESISLDQYRLRIEAHGIPWSVFVKNICTDLMLSELRKLIVYNKINISDEEAAAYIEKQNTMFNAIKILQTQVRHILLIFEKNKSETKIRKQLLDIRKQIQEGEDFSKFARRYSQDKSSLNGGYIGWIQPGETVPEFEHAVNALKECAISKPIRTRYGYHLIQVLSRRNVQSSIQQQNEIARQIIGKSKADQVYAHWLHKLRNSSYVQYKLSELN